MDFYEFLKEDEAAEYVKRVGIEYRFDCYHENVIEGCHRLADFLEAFDKDYWKARLVFEKNCVENKYGRSCFKLGNYTMIGRGGDKNAQDAYKAFKLGCEYNDGASCHNAGLMHQTKRLEGKEDFAEAAKLLEHGCDLDYVNSCQILSTMYITGKPGLEKDMAKAFKAGLKACEGGHMYACANISQMYKRGDGVQQSDELAAKYKDRAKELYQKVTEFDQQELKFGE